MIIIYKGDDVDFADSGEISVTILSLVDLDGYTGSFEFLGVTKDFSADVIARKTFTFTYSAEETATFCLGQNYGTFTLFDRKHRKALVMRVIVEVLPASACGCCSKGDIVVGMVNAMSYGNLANKPSINGVTIDGDKTGADYGLAGAGEVVLHRKPAEWSMTPAQDAGESIQLVFNTADDAWVPFRGDIQIGNGKGDAEAFSLSWDPSDLFNTELTALSAFRDPLPAYTLGEQADKPLQGEMPFDAVPSEGSPNPVRSGGVYEAIKAAEGESAAVADSIAPEFDGSKDYPAGATVYIDGKLVRFVEPYVAASGMPPVTTPVPAIASLIPAEATPDNKLADQQFVKDNATTVNGEKGDVWISGDNLPLRGGGQDDSSAEDSDSSEEPAPVTIAEAIAENVGRIDQIESALDYILAEEGSSDDSESEEDYWGLTFTAEEPNSTIAMTKVGDAPAVSLETSVDGGLTWQPFIIGETVITLANVGDSVCFQAGDGGTGGDGRNLTTARAGGYSNQFVLRTGRIAASGDISSLLDREGTVLDLSSRGYCFSSLFSECSALVSAPALPATVLAQSCYGGMFLNCSSLASAPYLPAATLQPYCYDNMFNGCTSLVSAPELIAETLKNGCYNGMFRGCTSIRHITVHFIEWYPSAAARNWLNGVPAPTVETPRVFECPPDLDTEAIRDASHVPEGWEVVKF